mgnify:CR=1 FL=1
MKYAIIEIGGKQLWVEPEKYYQVNFINVAENTTINLNKILLINDEGNIKLGEPYLENTSLEAKVLSHMRGPKLLVYKMRPKKKTRKKQGHRQKLSKLLINKISS